MENYVGKICPFCKAEIKEGDAVKVCPACGIAHHESCWDENKGCTTLGCSEQQSEVPETNPAKVCSNCGAELAEGQAFCSKCGAPSGDVKKNVCGKCGAELQEGQEFCAKCGQKVGLTVDESVSAAINQFNSNVAATNTNRKKPLIIGICIAIAVIVIIALFSSGGGKKDFNKMYSDISAESWCTIASDGTWIKFDTNPYDIEDSFEISAWYKIKSVLVDLGFASSVSEEMNETTALMGKQSAYTDGYAVSWSYHPDKGLEVMFKIDD